MKSSRFPKTRTNIALLAGVSLIISACGGSDDPPADSAIDPNSSGQQTPTPAPTPGPATAPNPTPGPTPTPVTAPMPPETGFDPSSNEATYRITFTAQWTRENGFGNVPGSAHFSPVIAAQVNEQSSLWSRGQKSSPGLEQVAEAGTTDEFAAQINAEVAANAAREVVIFSSTDADNSSSTEITFSRVFPLLTFASMVAPSPDWFVGVNKFSLLGGSSEWFEQIRLDLPTYDAGTEEGDGFSLNGAPTNPLAVIERLNQRVAGELNFVDGLVNGNAIASIQLTRIR